MREAIKEIDNNIKILEESNKKMQEMLVDDVKKEPLAKRKGKK